MSTSYGIRCPYHGLMTECGMQHSPHRLAQIIEKRQDIDRIFEIEDVEISVLGWIGWGGSPFSFVASHKNCALEVYNEYGDTYNPT